MNSYGSLVALVILLLLHNSIHPTNEQAPSSLLLFIRYLPECFNSITNIISLNFSKSVQEIHVDSAPLRNSIIETIGFSFQPVP